MGLFRKGKTHIIAKFLRTDFVICSHSRIGKPPFYSRIAGPRSAIGRAPDVEVRGPGFDTRSGNILSSSSAFSRRAVVSYWWKYVHEVLVNRLGGLSLPRKSVVRLTDRPDMTLDVYRGRKTTIQQHSRIKIVPRSSEFLVHGIYWDIKAIFHLLSVSTIALNEHKWS